MAEEKSFDTEKEFAGVDLHSIRLEQRFIRSMETLIQQPDKSVREASENRAEAKAIHRSYPDALDHRGNDTEHDLCGAACAGAALFSAFGGKTSGNCCIARRKDQAGTEEAVYDKRSGRAPWTAVCGGGGGIPK